jgi:activator of 2-hydroxyglutaryl-CoA dehydratase
LLHRGRPREDIARALHCSVVEKITGLFKRLEAVPGPVFLSGGGAKNAALRLMLQTALGRPVVVPDDPQIVGAVGCALCAAGE